MFILLIISEAYDILPKISLPFMVKIGGGT